MRTVVILLFCLSVTSAFYAQSIKGAWEAYVQKDGKPVKNVVIFADGYQASAYYDAQTGAFISTNGGGFQLDGSTVTETVEFDTENAENVGTTTTFDIELSDNELKIKDGDIVWKRIDDGSPGALNGAWLISGRMREGEIQKRDTDRPRKTMKILSGTRFQWIAYNTETKQFMGTGGGTYTTEDGKYIENIKFFSRDDSRVGASLEFEFELKDGDWHHSGLSSKGQPIYEIWSLRE